jgi:hypothetical protein
VTATFSLGLIGEDHPAGEQELFHIAIAEPEPERESYGVADDLDWEAVVLITVN